MHYQLLVLRVQPEQEQAIELLRDNYQSVGVVFEDHITDDTLYTVTDEHGAVIGAAVIEHLHDVTMLHQLAVESSYRGRGIGEELVDRIVADTPHRTLEAKCHTGSEANEFFRATGWSHVRETGDGTMNVWHYSA